MGCEHTGFHGIKTTYDHTSGVLVYHWTCDACGKRLGEARREDYRPQFDPHGNEPFLSTATAGA